MIKSCKEFTMKELENITENYFSDNDLQTCKTIFGDPNLTKKDLLDLYKDHSIVKVGDTLEDAYNDYVEFEECACTPYQVVSYETFIEEVQKGYGVSGCIQIARLFILESGVWYDNDYS